MEAKIRELEIQAELNEEARAQKVDNILATIPSESTVNECTQSYLEKSNKIKEITLAGKTATSSIAASSESGAANIYNELAKAVKTISASRESAIATIDNCFDNTQVYQQIANARSKAMNNIADKATAVLDGIRAADPSLQNQTTSDNDDIDTASSPG